MLRRVSSESTVPAAVAATTDWQARFSLPNDIVKGYTLCSGMYDLEAPRLSKRSAYVRFSDEMEAELSPQRHLEDTIAAGRGAVNPAAAEVLCAEAPARVLDLEHLGVRFDADRHGHLALGLEGGHNARRIAHAGGSATGRRVTRQLSALVAEHPHIPILPVLHGCFASHSVMSYAS